MLPGPVRTRPGVGLSRHWEGTCVRATRYGYDSLRDVVSITDAHNGVEHFTYDNGGHLLNQVNQLGHSTAYSYDALGRVTSITDPTGRVDSRSYDKAGASCRRKHGPSRGRRRLPKCRNTTRTVGSPRSAVPVAR
jgi:YD repeat-containing protein